MDTIKLFKFTSLLILTGAFLLYACAPSQGPGEPEPEDRTPPTPATLSPLEIARQKLSEQLNIDQSAVQVHLSEETQWPNSCLGLPSAGEMCAEVITPGYVGILIADGVQYEFRINADGSEVRFIPGGALSARQVLAQQLGIEVNKIRFVNIEKVEWANSCLEIDVPGEGCAQVIVPGYRVELDVNGQHYVYHTDETAGNVRLSAAPEPQIERTIITWSQSTDDGCETAIISMDSIAFGACGGALLTADFASENRASDVAYFRSKYTSFEGNTLAGQLAFTGQGDVTATTTEQRMIAEWARLTYQEAVAGRSGASWGLAFAWHREGGIVGFCDDLSVYVTGEVYASSCKSGQPENLQRAWLTSNEMKRVYEWLDNFQTFELEQRDPATADAMTVQLVFSGIGQNDPNEAEKQAILDLAAKIYNQSRVTPNPEDLKAAREALATYFDLLSQGQYEQAVDYYGGDYEPLPEYNPDIPPGDFPALLEAACTRNGFACLPIKTFVADAQLSATYFRFTLEFQNPDGSLFVFGPCCGATPQEMPPQTQFDYFVEKVDNRFLVQNLPVLLP